MALERFEEAEALLREAVEGPVKKPPRHRDEKRDLRHFGEFRLIL